ncbi:hypothetical protein CBR_g46833 [Chara braunii]|uniref:Uncharacterized protein n=1 Tax=Chara braunii TaxID=69332 RepID=A0A388M111_CHABU|nr:hypothetical protein CBR_g46833 [Chara braunii]|eukprot:GBG88267.1 hypothetical protein CBR_g46833 [Chara braunii]
MEYQNTPPATNAIAQPSPSPAPGVVPPVAYPLYPYGWVTPLVQLPPPSTWQQGAMSYPPPAREREKQGPAANAFPGPGNRAWFTREHLELIERWKNRDLLEDSKRKNEESGECSKSENTRKAKGKAKSEDGEQRLKNWMATNFGASFKKIADKLDEVDKKTKEADHERVKLMQKVAELDTGHNEDAGSNEKRKRVINANSPLPERQKSRSRSRSGGIKIRQPSILVSSDDEDKNSAPQRTKIEGEPSDRTDEPVKLDDVMKMLAIIANKVNLEDAS